MSEELLAMLAEVGASAIERPVIRTLEGGEQPGEPVFNAQAFLAALDARGYRVVHK